MGHATGRRHVRWAINGLVAMILLGTTATAFAVGEGVILLNPNNAGPYSGGEAINVQILLRNTTTQQLPLSFVRLDYVDSAAAIDLPANMTWSLVPPPGTPALPVPTFRPPSPTLNVVPAGGQIQLGMVVVRLPKEAGCYVLDVMNSNDSNTQRGAEIHFVLGTVVVGWRAFTGQLQGGRLSFNVGGVGSPERCNNEDDDCDGLVDEDFYEEQFDPDTGLTKRVGPGNTCVLGKGNCEFPGRLRCSADGMSIECIPAGQPGTSHPEGPYLDRTCFNLDDDDCDGLYDFEDPDCQGPEICDGFDNNNNGVVDELWPQIGQRCTAGLGACKQNGVLQCSRNGINLVCSADPLTPGVEGPPDWFNCSDGFDNDCDELVDIRDPDCQTPEVCDGKDNDGDGQVDENFPNLGQACQVGVGECLRTGIVVCRADHSGVKCSVSPGAPKPEGPGCDCGNGLDDDCDGLIDIDDPDCGGNLLRVQAALVPTCVNPDGDCVSWHEVDWNVINGGPPAVETAEILALDLNGASLGSLPVNKGDVVRLTSRINAADFDINTFSFTAGLAFYDARFLPCMMGPDIKVPTGCQYVDTDCDRDVDLADAAWLQNHFEEFVEIHEVIAPRPVLHVHANNGLTRENAYVSPVPHIQVWQPNETVVPLQEGDRVKVEIALANVDLPSLELFIDGVSVFPAIGINPATDFPGGPYGGNVPLPNNCTAHLCELIVDAADVSTLSGNTLRMYVEGMCCGGHRIVARSGVLAGSYPLPIPAQCDPTDMRDDGVSHGFQVVIISPADGGVDPAPPTTVFGFVCHGLKLNSPTPSSGGIVKVNGAEKPLSPPMLIPGDGTFTADTYTYSFETSLPETNLFQDFIGAIHVPGTLDPGGNKLIAECMDPGLNTAFDLHHIAVGPILAGPEPASSVAGGGAIPHGFAVIADEPTFVTIVTEALRALAPLAVEAMENALDAMKGTVVTIPTDACDVDVRVLVDNPIPFDFDMDPNAFTFNVVLSANQVDIEAISGPIHAEGSVRGTCEIEGIFGECFIRLKVRVGAMVDITQAGIKVVITEVDLENQNDLTPTLDIDNNDVDITVADVGTDVECWGGILAQILSFGTIEIILEAVIEDKLQDFLDDLDVTQFLALIPVPPIPLDVLDFDPVNIESLQVEFNFGLTEVEITANGLSVGFDTEFVPTTIDPEVQVFPGLPNTIAVLPLPPLPDPPANGLSALLQDDTVNQLLYALTRNGIIKTQFEDERQLQDLLPAMCNTLPPLLFGQCEAIKGTDCITLPTPNEVLACIATSVLLNQLNLSGTTPILLHGRVDVSPTIYWFRSTGNGITAFIRLSQTFVGIVAGRDGDGNFSGDYSALPSCFGGNPATVTECQMWGQCFNVNFSTLLTLGPGPGSTQRITLSLSQADLSTATGCSGGTASPAGSFGFEEVFEGQVFDLIQAYVDNNVPPLDIPGLDFGGIVALQNLFPMLFGTAFDANFEDWGGLTADVVPSP
ncbi:MAG: hypothetical protein AABZ47_18510 [Planctomycetota bacterium]